jgi:hypothetical protein
MRIIADITDPAEAPHAATFECSHNLGLKSKPYGPEKKQWVECDRLQGSNFQSTQLVLGNAFRRDSAELSRQISKRYMVLFMVIFITRARFDQ